MRALKFIRHPVQNKIIIVLPESYGDNDVEITITPLKNDNTKKENNFEKYCGFMKDIKMDTDVEIDKMRNEWKRDIY